MATTMVNLYFFDATIDIYKNRNTDRRNDAFIIHREGNPPLDDGPVRMDHRRRESFA